MGSKRQGRKEPRRHLEDVGSGSCQNEGLSGINEARPSRTGCDRAEMATNGAGKEGMEEGGR